jgi:flagellar biosynthesis protein FlhG
VPDAPTLKLVKPVQDPGVREPARRPARPRRVISIGGGKGGIGKSLVATNLAIELARRGERVVLIDADLGGANLHTCLGMDQPRRTLSDFVDRRVARIEDVITPTGIENLGLVSGAMDHFDAANPRHAQKMRLMRHIQEVGADDVIIDLGAGTHLTVLDFFLVSDHGVLVLVPEPTAVENVYRFVKSAFWRRVRNVVSVCGFEEQLRSVMGEGTFQSPVEIIAALSARHPDAGKILSRQLEQFRPRLIVNQARTPQDAEVGNAVVSAWRKFFGLEMDYLGHVQHDPQMWQTVRARKPALVQPGPSGAPRGSFALIADRLAALDAALARSEART